MNLFELSGEDRTLACYELRTVIETFGREWEPVREHRSAVVLAGVGRIAPLLARRLAFTRRVASIADDARIDRAEGLKVRIGAKRFAIVPKKVDPIAYSLQDAVVKLGASVLEQNPGSKVDLGKPDVRIYLFGTRDRLYASKVVHEVDRKGLEARAPKLRPIRSPVSMHPRLCRAMVNLARVREGDIVLDPFCGTGGTLIEASDMGMRAFGIDISEKMVFASKENLRHFGLKGSVVQGDAVDLSRSFEAMKLKTADALVSDLPYGRSTTLAGRKQEDLVTRFVSEAYRALRPGRCMVLCINDERMLLRALKLTDFEIVERFERRVHRSLTRYIAVLRKP